MHAGPGIARNTQGLGIRNVFGMHGLGEDDISLPSDGYGIDPVTSIDLLGSQIDTSGVPLNALVPVTTDVATGASGGSSLNAAQIAQIIGTSANAAVGIYKATSTPSVIAGTGAIYNPATGQILGATGLTNLTAGSLGSLLPLLLLAGGGLLLISAMGKR